MGAVHEGSHRISDEREVWDNEGDALRRANFREPRWGDDHEGPPLDNAASIDFIPADADDARRREEARTIHPSNSPEERR